MPVQALPDAGDYQLLEAGYRRWSSRLCESPLPLSERAGPGRKHRRHWRIVRARETDKSWGGDVCGCRVESHSRGGRSGRKSPVRGPSPLMIPPKNGRHIQGALKTELRRDHWHSRTVEHNCPRKKVPKHLPRLSRKNQKNGDWTGGLLCVFSGKPVVTGITTLESQRT